MKIFKNGCFLELDNYGVLKKKNLYKDTKNIKVVEATTEAGFRKIHLYDFVVWDKD